MMKKLRQLLCLMLIAAVLLPAAALGDQQYFLDSDKREITEAELWQWDRESLSFMFNEIFARHGFTFDVGGKFYNWFNSQPWYQQTPKVTDQQAYHATTRLEWKNYETIKKVINDMVAAGHPYRRPAGSKLKSWIDFQPPGNWSLTGFEYVQLTGNQSLPVYSAPSAASWRGANGKASVSTNGAIWAAGWENGWLQVFYEVNNGGLRVGYVDGKTIKGKISLNTQLTFAWVPVSVMENCALTDDPLQSGTTITRLGAGSTVTYLTTVTNQNGFVWDYVETSVNGQTVRGYVRSGSLDVPGEDAPDLSGYYNN